MTSLAANFDDVVRYDTIDERSGELALREGRVVTGSDETGTELRVDVDGGIDETYDLGTFRYELDGREIAYDGGGVFRAEESGTVAITRPSMRCGDETAVVSLVRIDADDRTLRSGEVQEFTIKEEGTMVDRTFDDGTNVDVKITVEDSDYETGWESVLDHGDWEWDGDDTGECAAVDRATIRIVEADLEY